MCAAALWAAVGVPIAPQRPVGPSAGTAIPRLRIGVDANPKATTSYRSDDYVASIELMKTTGANDFHYAKVWSEIEPRAGIYDTSDVAFKTSQSAPLPIAFNLRVLDAGNRNMPPEYVGLAWDSAEMIAHVAAVADTIAPVLGGRVWSYAVGNEIDLYFSKHPAEVAAYARMLASIKARVRAHHPGAAFTACFQFAAARQLSSLYAPIVDVLDQVTFTYYPINADFSVRPETDFPSDLQTMIAAAAPRRIFLQEIGYPTSALLGSSEERQRAFVRLAFDTLRTVGTTRVAGATYLFQADLPQWLVDQIVVAYGNDTTRFREFLTTLGLRDDQDRAKPAWNEFVTQAGLVRSR